MNPPVRPSSRFIPTLTEVVEAPSEPARTASSAALVAEIMETMLPLMEARLRAGMRASLEQQVREAMVQLQGPLEHAVRDALRKSRQP